MLISLFFYCSFTIHAQQTIKKTLIHDGIEREYILYIPANYTGNTLVPVVFNFHGYTANAAQQMRYGDFRPLAEQHGFLIVHPQGTIDIHGNTHFNVGRGRSTTDDVGFTAALIEELSSSYMIDSKRIYSTGMSNGAFMSYRLACELNDKIAAIASVTGSMVKEQQNNCTILHPTPILEIHGTSDHVIPYDGNNDFEAITDVLNFWTVSNNGDITAVITAIEDSNTTDDTTAEHHVYAHGDNGVTVEHFKIIGGTHKWPGNPYPSSGTNYDIDTATEIWKFFSKYDIDGATQVLSVDNESVVRNAKMNIYPNPATSYIKVGGNSIEQRLAYKIISLQGMLITTGKVTPRNAEINISSLTSGVYFLIIENTSYKILKI